MNLVWTKRKMIKMDNYELWNEFSWDEEKND